MSDAENLLPREVSIEKHLAENIVASLPKQTPASRAAAADAIRELAKQITDKVSIDELIAQKHSDHRH